MVLYWFALLDDVAGQSIWPVAQGGGSDEVLGILIYVTFAVVIIVLISWSCCGLHFFNILTLLCLAMHAGQNYFQQLHKP